MRAKTAMILVLAVCLSAVSAERIATGRGAGQEGGALDDRFTLENALFSLGVVRECLQSFQKLTAEVKGKIAVTKITEIGNTGWEMQTLGFHNLPGTLEGTLLKQDVEIKRLAWENAGLRMKAGATGEKEWTAARAAYDESGKAYESFKARFRVKD